MQYGAAATEMLRELQRSKKPLPPYNTDAMQRVVQETNDCIALMQAQKELHVDANRPYPMELAPALFLEGQSVQWNKRCALAYLHERLGRIKTQWWDTNGVLPHSDAEVRANMAPHELRFFEEYNGCVSEYMARTSVLVTQDHVPPRSVWVSVQVLRSVEPIVGFDGQPILLRAGNRKRMRRVDAENLIRQGIVALAE